ncbi:unnamed protein product [Brassica oleracea]|nr:unnamed protein product [Brassica oleracea]
MNRSVRWAMVCSQSADTRPCGTSSRRLDLSTERSTVARFSLANLASDPPNTIDDHASVVFNTYYQHYKHNGGSCYFHRAAVIIHTDPSHGSCHFKYAPDSKERAKMT